MSAACCVQKRPYKPRVDVFLHFTVCACLMEPFTDTGRLAGVSLKVGKKISLQQMFLGL